MADRCDHCGVRMDGLEVHADLCPVRGAELVQEYETIKTENAGLKVQIRVACENLGRARAWLDLWRTGLPNNSVRALEDALGMGQEPPMPETLYCDTCGEELQREACNHVRACVGCAQRRKSKEADFGGPKD